MDAIEKAVAKYRVAVAEHQAAEVKLTEARAGVVAALGLGAVADSSTSNEVAKPATPPVKAPAKPAPKPKAAAAPAPKAAAKPAPVTAAPWTPVLAKKLLGEIAGGAAVLRAVAKAGGSVAVDQVPRADGEGVMGVASVSPFLANVRSRARSAGIELPIASQGDGKVTLDPGLCAVLREMGGAA